MLSRVLLMNVRGYNRRKTEDIQVYRQQRQKLYLADQDVINALFCERTLLLMLCINLDEKTFKRFKNEIDNNWIDRNTVIVHLTEIYNLEGRIQGRS